MELQVRGKGYGCSDIHHLDCTIKIAMVADCLKYMVPAASLIEGKCCLWLQSPFMCPLTLTLSSSTNCLFVLLYIQVSHSNLFHKGHTAKVATLDNGTMGASFECAAPHITLLRKGGVSYFNFGTRLTKSEPTTDRTSLVPSSPRVWFRVCTVLRLDRRGTYLTKCNQTA